MTTRRSYASTRPVERLDPLGLDPELLTYWREIAAAQGLHRRAEVQAAIEEDMGGEPVRTVYPRETVYRNGDALDDLELMIALDRSPLRKAPVLILRCRLAHHGDMAAPEFCGDGWHYRREKFPARWAWVAFERCPTIAGESRILVKYEKGEVA